MDAIAIRLEAIAIRLAIATRLEAIAIRLDAIATRVEAIPSRVEAIACCSRFMKWLGASGPCCMSHRVCPGGLSRTAIRLQELGATVKRLAGSAAGLDQLQEQSD